MAERKIKKVLKDSISKNSLITLANSWLVCI